MPMELNGSCQCGAVHFTVQSHTPVPDQRCYCSICRKSTGGGFAVNIGAVSESLSVDNWEGLESFHAALDDGGTSNAERFFCTACGSQLWLYDDRWPELIHPLASVIDTPLPAPVTHTHIMLSEKPDWVAADINTGDRTYDTYPELSLADWHRANGAWVD